MSEDTQTQAVIAYGETTTLATSAPQMTQIAWIPHENITYDEWCQAGYVIRGVGRSLNFWWGDWLAAGDFLWGEMYTQALEETGLAMETLSKYKRVAERVPVEIRKEDLSWTHHFAVAYCYEPHRGPLLDLASHFQISTRDFKEIAALSTAQQQKLLAEFAEGRLTDAMTLQKRINFIRLTVSDDKIINTSPQMRMFENETPSAENDEDDEDDDLPYHSGPILDEEEADVLFIEEVIGYFEERGPKMQVCASDHAVWPNLSVQAALDRNGKPVLKWKREGA